MNNMTPNVLVECKTEKQGLKMPLKFRRVAVDKRFYLLSSWGCVPYRLLRFLPFDGYIDKAFCDATIEFVSCEKHSN